MTFSNERNYRYCKICRQYSNNSEYKQIFVTLLNALTMALCHENVTKQNILILSQILYQILSRIESDKTSNFLDNSLCIITKMFIQTATRKFQTLNLPDWDHFQLPGTSLDVKK